MELPYISPDNSESNGSAVTNIIFNVDQGNGQQIKESMERSNETTEGQVFALDSSDSS